MKKNFIVKLFFLTFIASITAFASGIKAGASVQKITPEMRAGEPIYIAGYDNDRTATGIHDDLHARCLVLSEGKKTIAFVTLDLIGYFHSEVLKVRQVIKKKLPQIDHVIISSTHDHEGPDVMGLWGKSNTSSGINPEYMRFIRKQIIKGIWEAYHNMVPVHVLFAKGKNNKLNSLIRDIRPPIVKDWTVLGMRFVSLNGNKTIATVVNWPCHAEALGPKNTLITADFPGYLCRKVEEHFGGAALFWNGAIGGLLTTTGPNTYANAKKIGYTVADIIDKKLDNAKIEDKPILSVKTKTIFIPLLNKHFRLALSIGVLKRNLYSNGKVDNSNKIENIPHLGKINYVTGKDMRTEVSVLKFGTAEIVVIPGELYPELANGGITRLSGADFPNAPFEPTIRKHMKGKYKFLIGLGDDEIGYIIPKSEWDNKAPWLDGSKDETYGEINSLGYETAPIITKAVVNLLK